MIGGFIVQGTGTKSVIIRAIGPELTQYGITNALANPALELHNAAGALIGSNDNWQTTILGGIITGNQATTFRTAAAFRLRQANRRLSQICNRAITRRLCAV